MRSRFIRIEAHLFRVFIGRSLAKVGLRIAIAPNLPIWARHQLRKASISSQAVFTPFSARIICAISEAFVLY